MEVRLARELLETLSGGCYSLSNARSGDEVYHMTLSLWTLYEALGTWQAVADELALSKPYVWRVAHGDLVPSAAALAKWEEYRARMAKV